MAGHGQEAIATGAESLLRLLGLENAAGHDGGRRPQARDLRHQPAAHEQPDGQGEHRQG